MFTFLHPGSLIDGDLELMLAEQYPEDPPKQYVPTYRFKMVLTGTVTQIGHIELRIGNTPHLILYGGHIGYGVHPEYRGWRYAARSVRLLIPLARRHNLGTLWITCNPENMASRRTCELAGFEFVEIVNLPPETDMYQEGERRKCRYRLRL